MRIGWYVVDNGQRRHPWSLERHLYARSTRVGTERRGDGHGRAQRWDSMKAAQEAADKLNREEALS